MLHDMKKLKAKPTGEFTAQDLNFVKDSVCKDGKCFGGAMPGFSSVTTVAVSICSLGLFLF